jgi:hypothetical protein
MLPNKLTHLPALPLTSSGKVDRQMLWSMATTDNQSRATVAPRNKTEQALVEIWRSVLDLQEVSTEEKFADIGGTSLRAANIVQRVRKVFKVDLSPVQFIRAQTIAELARIIATSKAARDGDLGEIEPLAANVPVPLSRAQLAWWELERARPGWPFANIGLKITIRGALDIDGLKASLEEIRNRHDALRNSVRLVDGQVVTLPANAPFRFPTADLRRATSEDRERQLALLWERSLSTPWDLAAGEVFRLHLVRIADDHAVLLWVLHHIVCDGEGITLIFDELSLLYSSYRNHSPVRLRDAPSMRAFVNWETKMVAPARREARETYLHSQMDSAEPFAPKCFGDRQDLQMKLPVVGHEWIVQAELLKGLRALAHSADTSLYVTALAMFQILFQCESDPQNILIGHVFRNRRTEQSHSVVGEFAIPIPLRFTLSLTATIREAMLSVRDAVLHGLAHEDAIPYPEVHATGEYRVEPRFRTLFNNGAIQSLSLEGCEVTAEELTSTEPFPGISELIVEIIEMADQLRATLIYSPEQARPEDVVRMCQQLDWISNVSMTTPDRTLKSLSEEMRRSGLMT